jgi:formate dehydrogenase major subunit
MTNKKINEEIVSVKQEIKMINLKINDKDVSVQDGSTILDAAKKLEVKIPTLCHRDGLKPFTSCFMCVVEVVGAKNLMPSCSTLATEGMEVLTETDDIRSTRKVCLELLVSEHLGDCVSPCRTECPADLDVKAYLKAIAIGDQLEAIKIIKEGIVLPSSIGRVCPRPCESVCRRKNREGSVAICALKRFAGDYDLNSDEHFKPEIAKKTGKKVAIIGGGPSGLTAAYFLICAGHNVKIFEANQKAGGYLQYGIPQYRLPKEVLDKEIEQIINLGINIEYGVKVGRDISLAGLKKEGYDATLVAIGAQDAASMRVEGEDVEGVISGVEFLEKVAMNPKYDPGKKVIVVGGGNTAIDAARTSIRLGADTTILYRRSKQEMPAEHFEVVAADKEGVKIEILSAPVKITSEDGKLKVQCVKMEQGACDSSGRRSSVIIEGSKFDLEVDTIIGAIGQKVSQECIKCFDIEPNDWGMIKAQEETGQIGQSNLFACGECVTGPGIASRAMGLGKQAAISIIKYLNGEEVKAKEKQFIATMGDLEEIPEEFYTDIKHAKRYSLSELYAHKRVNNFLEVEQGYKYKEAKEEAELCLECGCLKADNCLLRDLITEYKADPERLKGETKTYYFDKSHKDIVFESNKCILCGRCVRYSNEVKNTDVITGVR